MGVIHASKIGKAIRTWAGNVLPTLDNHCLATLTAAWLASVVGDKTVGYQKLLFVGGALAHSLVGSTPAHPAPPNRPNAEKVKTQQR